MAARAPKNLILIIAREFASKLATATVLADAAGVAALLAARDAADFGDEHDPDDVSAWWSEEPERLATDTWVVLDGDRTVGYAQMRRNGGNADLADESCVHPHARGRGIGGYLVTLAETWASERGLSAVYAGVVNDGGRQLLRDRGYALVRHFWRMEIEPTEEPQAPPPAPGVEVRRYRPGEDDEAVWTVVQAAFAGHFGWVPRPLGPWLRARTRRSDYEPELWQLAYADGELAGVVLPFGSKRFGWILELAVLERWRGRGIGLVLLRTAFRELWRRGHTQIGLEVDAANESGATRLYERAGMRVTRRYDMYEKRLAG